MEVEDDGFGPPGHCATCTCEANSGLRLYPVALYQTCRTHGRITEPSVFNSLAEQQWWESVTQYHHVRTGCGEHLATLVDLGYEQP